MNSDPRVTLRPSNEPPGLPPVSPPTGKFLMQLFLVPGLIVALIVCLLLFIYWMFNGPHSPESYLKNLDDNNVEVRWRAAVDLAQVLPRDADLASDAGFALQLADRLQKAREAHAAAEAEWATKAKTATQQEAEVELKKLEAERSLILYLSSSLSHFKIPAGCFILMDMAVQEGKIEPKYLARQRRQAVWLLANLGESVNSFDKLSPFRQATILQQLETATEEGPRGTWASACLENLRNRQEGKPGSLGVDKVLIQCSEDENPFLREMAAFAMIFWIGSLSEEAAIEEALVHLSHDDGRGEDQLTDLLDDEAEEEAALTFITFFKKNDTRTLVKKKGYKVQITATIALARRGSTRTRIELLEEMLDPIHLRQVFLTINKKTQEQKPDEAVVVQTVVNSLKALAKLHEKQRDLPLKGCPGAVEKLAESDNAAIRKEAAETLKVLNTRSEE